MIPPLTGAAINGSLLIRHRRVPGLERRSRIGVLLPPGGTSPGFP
ncbi:hypothetical protein CZ774_12365 [Frigoribacterium sp. JB110]|nr:hypothetical protein CZ774_12365 [Frigoribacterium sp. JB110]